MLMLLPLVLCVDVVAVGIAAGVSCCWLLMCSLVVVVVVATYMFAGQQLSCLH